MSSRFALLTVLALLLAGVAFMLLTLRPVGTEAATARGTQLQVEESPASAEVVGQPVEAALPRTQVVREEPTTESSVQPAPEELWLAVRVITAATYRNNAAPVANVEVAVGVGPANSPTAEVLATGTTDAEGVCELRIPWSVAEAARNNGGRVWARPSGAGWIEQTRHRTLPKVLEDVEIKLQPRPGFTVRGRLLGEHGEPTTGNAQAEGITLTGEQAHGFGSVDSEGWFEVHVDDAGTYDLVGTPPYLHGDKVQATVYAGTGVARRVQIDASHLPQDLIIQLQGPGVVRGRVQTAAGQPVAGLDLSINSVRLGATGGYGFGSYKRLLTEGLGAPHASVRTDTDGEFEVRGLRAGDFNVKADNEQTLLNPVSLPSDGEPIVLVLDHPHMVVQLVDEDGAPWQGKLARAASFWSGASKEWSVAPRIVVAPARPSPLSASWESFGFADRVRGKGLGGGSMSFETQPGVDYLVGLAGGPGAWNPTLVHAPESGGRVDVELRVVPGPGMGSLSLTVSDANRALTDGIVVHVEDPDSGFTILSWDSWPFEMTLPAGDYRLAVEGSAFTDSHHGTMLRPSNHGRFATSLHITAGQVTQVEAYLPTGARIDLTLGGETEDADRDAVLASWGEGVTGDLEFFATRARVRLLAEGHWPRRVEFRWEDTQTSAAGTHLTPNLEIGTQQVSELLPAGRYTLEAHMPGGRVASVPVTLVDGETLSVTLEL